MSRTSGRQPMISILNNDDNPAFAVRPVQLAKHQTDPLPYATQQLRHWPGSEGYNGQYHPERLSPELASARSTESPYHYRMTPSPEPPAHPFGQLPKMATYPPLGGPRDAMSPHSSYSRLSVERIMAKDRRRSGEPLSPQPSLSGLSDMKTPKINKKNKYPCPYAISHSCPATFTTSGHAARHGKKHTGEKSVLCPVCKKAFTRKDNMKQHRRTHRESDPDTDNNGVTSSNSTSNSTADNSSRSPRPAASKFRRHSSRSSSHSYGGSSQLDPNESSYDQRPSSSGYRSESLASGLNSLAIAANNSKYGG
ncbi:hypothetical protein FQN57_005196 [Myotisia sp. PD_48]|nr:hypothetical protein FQN57_005196 [Myotisia sp. PD_48]